ncbi:Glu/Leu/Phe/Val dehydrogenase dimerization domain-containing protein [Amycolatopsis mongoliensis]|uniref:Glutamate dehydrogenase n=1 Tax=Amycolatopsis mongoliensis TaxID=715475 RepID=A0A9Y2JSZ4_9PSEU|nr:Glu/Leu/Phe/Val dehydrogenase dimerization domain-containing protein [Amycolatopsis sp. 4-36]WIY03111.1 Glu/Leu/Phe/Val dehydrogenase dimerization domain-containing protein [Amycolatopsis sp. 4-36]
MSEPALLEVAWTDPVTGCRGYLVIDRLVRGVASGGLRMRRGCTLFEVRGLARGMTLKEGLNYDPDGRYVPLGGAKGGIDFDPYDERAREVVARYLDAMRPLIERYWTMGEDLGLRQDVIDDVIAEIGLLSPVQAVYPLLEDREAATERLVDAFRIEVGGLGLDELVGGLGVAQATLSGLEMLGLGGPNRVVVQGFGSMGGATARFLAEAGLQVVGVSDVRGVVVNPDGLDVENLLRHRDRFGGIDRDNLGPGDELLPPEAWLDVPAEVLVPAAISYCVDSDNQAKIGAKLIVEAANLPVTADAEALLDARGIRVLPDFVANSATNSWWWWTLFGDVGADAEEAFGKVRTRMRDLVTGVFERATLDGLSLRAAALQLSEKNLEAIQTRFG